MRKNLYSKNESAYAIIDGAKHSRVPKNQNKTTLMCQPHTNTKFYIKFWKVYRHSEIQKCIFCDSYTTLERTPSINVTNVYSWLSPHWMLRFFWKKERNWWLPFPITSHSSQSQEVGLSTLSCRRKITFNWWQDVTIGPHDTGKELKHWKSRVSVWLLLLRMTDQENFGVRPSFSVRSLSLNFLPKVLWGSLNTSDHIL